jgi:hypothetical protein
MLVLDSDRQKVMIKIRNILLTIIFLGLTIFINAQTVDSIKVEQAGDKILIHYKILLSDEQQVFRVTLSCFLSTGIKLEPKSITGDVGESVTGGKSEYMIVWDVLKDLEELQTAEFSVKAELVKGRPTSQDKNFNPTGWDKKRVHIMGSVLLPGPKYGGMISYLGKWGIGASFLYGATAYSSTVTNGNFSAEMLPKKVFFTIDAYKRLVNIEGFQMHLGPGFALNYHLLEDLGTHTSFKFKKASGIHWTLVIDIKRITIYGGVATFPVGKNTEPAGYGVRTADPYFNGGIGLRF